jgi:hypothetical protein
MKPIFPKEGTQHHKVLMALLRANGAWLSGTYFLRNLYISQYHARIFALENKYHWKIEHSNEKDEYGFVLYRDRKSVV